MRGHREEEDVPQDSTTPTFVALKLRPANWRWAGVQFTYDRKNDATQDTKNSIHFKLMPHVMFPVEDL